MIGYYVHHVGRGHVDRASAIIAALDEPVTVLSSLAPPTGWPGEWIVLEPDDGGTPMQPAVQYLHWAPLHHPGLQDRMARISTWIARARPSAFVVDLSVEVSVLARLCGVPVITTVLPGRRDDDAHQLGFRLADAIIAPWAPLDARMATGLAPHRAKLHHVGGLSRFDDRSPESGPPATARNALRFGGAGGVRCLPPTPATIGWTWTERSPRNWTEDPWPDLCAASVVVTHCGLGALADAAAARRPAVLLPEARPHEEQTRTALGIAATGLGIVLESEPDPEEWPPILDRALRLDTSRWQRWSTGDAAERAARIIADVARRSP